MRHSVRYFGVAALAGLFLLSSCQKAELDTSKVLRGNFNMSFTETGELVTADTKVLVMPRFGRYWSSMRIIGMIDHGTRVSVGDSIIQLDPTPVQQFIIDHRTQLENAESDLQNLRVNNEVNNKNLDANLRSVEASFNMSRLQMESARFETEKQRKIRELQFRQAEIRYEKEKRNIEYTRIINHYNEIIQQIRMEQIRDRIEMAYAVLPQLVIRTPISGIFQVARRRRNDIKIGDEIRAGNSMGSVPDLTWMKVNTCINEVDRSKVSVGQSVIVRMDALPDVKFEAEVESIGLLCHAYSDNDQRKVFSVVVRIKKSDERLRPGMTVSCEFLSDHLKDVLYVANDYIYRENGRSFLWVENMVGRSKVPVRIVSHNNHFSVIEGDVVEGQKLLPVEALYEKQEKISE